MDQNNYILVKHCFLANDHDFNRYAKSREKELKNILTWNQ